MTGPVGPATPTGGRPLHLEHGLHTVLGIGGPAGPLDVATVAIGLPPAAVLAHLTVEGIRGGAGDRILPGTPRWLVIAGFAMVGYTAVLAARHAVTVRPA